MTKLIETTKRHASTAALTLCAIAAAGVGLVFLGFLAVFSLALIGLGLIAAPFVSTDETVNA